MHILDISISRDYTRLFGKVVHAMCGIVGLYLKNPALQSELGALFAPMLIAMGERGPDSAGFAIYGDETPDGWIKTTLRQADQEVVWSEVADALERRSGIPSRFPSMRTTRR